MSSIAISSISDINQAALHFSKAIENRTIIAFHGEMGAGKTTFIKALCSVLGVEEDQVNSPTFSVVNEYKAKNGTIYHFDFYRINKPQEALDFGIYDYFDSGALCLMEWPEQVASLLPDDCLHVTISVNDDKSRLIEY